MVRINAIIYGREDDEVGMIKISGCSLLRSQLFAWLFIDHDEESKHGQWDTEIATWNHNPLPIFSVLKSKHNDNGKYLSH